MCGICGSLRLPEATEEDRATVTSMLRRLEHRGPDGGGLWVHGGAVLGHRRLAIIDLEGGHQPLLNETGEIGVVFNGEIYNFRELRRQLSGLGHRFRTASDTEVLVHGYEQWGDEVVSRLRGMFAFALWDGARRRLLLVRDRLGVKPLYYHHGAGDGRLVFASEIKALFADPRVPRELNPDALAEYLAFRSVFGAETLFRQIRELEPGTMLVLDSGGARELRYWSPEVERERDGASGKRLADGRRLLREAVEVRLVSDVELGTITSGGLDSSLVSAIAAGLSEPGIDTFCVGFEDPGYDERPFARGVAGRIGSRHHEIVVRPEEIDRELDQLTWAHDEPLSHPNSVPMHLVFREAKERAGVTVLLSGEGADEVFGGYEWYSVAWRRERLRRIPGLARVSGLLPLGRLAVLQRVLHPDYLVLSNAVTDRASVRALAPEAPAFLERRRAAWPRTGGGVDDLFVYDQRTYLQPLLQRQDRMSMAAGVEARVPFLDHRLVEWANALRASDKLTGGRGKALLKSLAAPWLSPEIIHRKKVGFAMPLGDWLRPGGVLAGRVERLLDRSSVVGALVQRRGLERMIDEHRSHRRNRADVLWSLIALDAWAEVFLRDRVRDTRLPGAATGRPLPSPAVSVAGLS